MPRFGRSSKKQLKTCNKSLQELFNEVIKHFDCTIIEGYRNESDQNSAVANGFSKAMYPNGRHNKLPSDAVDVAPYPIDWDDTERFIYFAGFVKGIASQMDINIIWGGDWNNNTQLKDNNFQDLVHFELKK